MRVPLRHGDELLIFNALQVNASGQSNFLTLTVNSELSAKAIDQIGWVKVV